MTYPARLKHEATVTVSVVMPTELVSIQKTADAKGKRTYIRRRIVERHIDEISRGSTQGQVEAAWVTEVKPRVRVTEGCEWYAAWCEVYPDRPVRVNITFDPSSLSEVQKLNARVAKGRARRETADLAISVAVIRAREEFDAFVAAYGERQQQWYVDGRVRAGLEPNERHVGGLRLPSGPEHEIDEASIPSSFSMLDELASVPEWQREAELRAILDGHDMAGFMLSDSEKGRDVARKKGFTFNKTGKPKGGVCDTLWAYINDPSPVVRPWFDPTDTSRRYARRFDPSPSRRAWAALKKRASKHGTKYVIFYDDGSVAYTDLPPFEDLPPFQVETHRHTESKAPTAIWPCSTPQSEGAEESRKPHLRSGVTIAAWEWMRRHCPMWKDASALKAVTLAFIGQPPPSMAHVKTYENRVAEGTSAREDTAEMA